ncbi:hypothetical protein JFV28_11680 [Pseudomonas sp. TH05]|uniref:hypothetical protein n=1 Tax=unclassified Pseudomonas TaxID=196821 RepID=UPI0009983BBF|nr:MULTISPECIES: hypothetical protein [unclassified Pseudomonas]MBK5540578.1 hypothetical protein [Pseudomonas sp. TH07]MBK5556524.1 hypothetical protein [Pseudomonas sp. TH05]OOV91994.1 hypothetical protein MF4836_25065 [Pseudomonas sp. MF4836]
MQPCPLRDAPQTFVQLAQPSGRSVGVGLGIKSRLLVNLPMALCRSRLRHSSRPPDHPQHA